MMHLDDHILSNFIIDSYKKKLLSRLNVDAALVGTGPANMVAHYYFVFSEPRFI